MTSNSPNDPARLAEEAKEHLNAAIDAARHGIAAITRREQTRLCEAAIDALASLAQAGAEEARAESLKDSLRLDWCQRHAVGIENVSAVGGPSAWMVFGTDTGTGKTLREAIDDAAGLK